MKFSNSPRPSRPNRRVDLAIEASRRDERDVVGQGGTLPVAAAPHQMPSGHCEYIAPRDLRAPGRGTLPALDVAVPETTPIIRISRADDEVVLSIPLWSAASCAMAHRIAARTIEDLSHQGWPWDGGRVRVKPGRGEFSTQLLWWYGPYDEHCEHRARAITGALATAAGLEGQLYSFAKTGIITHRVEVLP